VRGGGDAGDEVGGGFKDAWAVCWCGGRGGLSPKQRAKPAASRTRTCTNATVCIASGECPSRF
jgi:hypothetical protein